MTDEERRSIQEQIVEIYRTLSPEGKAELMHFGWALMNDPEEADRPRAEMLAWKEAQAKQSE